MYIYIYIENGDLREQLALMWYPGMPLNRFAVLQPAEIGGHLVDTVI